VPFTWEFNVRRPSGPTSKRRCHRGPMIDVECVLGVPFKGLYKYNTLRKRLLDFIVRTALVQVQTREVLLRVLNSELGPIFARLQPRKASLQATICEKKSSLVIDQELKDYDTGYIEAARDLRNYGTPEPQIIFFEEALKSSNASLRVASRCAIVLLYAYIEMDNSSE